MGLWSRLRNLVRSDRHSGELDDELAFHLEMRASEHLAAGLSPDEAARHARLQFGNPTLLKERARDAGVPRLLDALLQDLRYALRALRASGGVAVIVVLTLGLGIGANTALFTIANALIFRSLPIRDPASLIQVQTANSLSYGYIDADNAFSFAMWRDFEQRQDSLQGAFAYAERRLQARFDGEPREINVAMGSPATFSSLGVALPLGRDFTAGEHRPEGAGVAIISHDLWRREFAADPRVLGRHFALDGKAFSIVGVAGAGFKGLHVGQPADVFVPLAAEPYLAGRDNATHNRSFYWLRIFGRVRPGLSTGDAAARLAAMAPMTMQATLPPELPERFHSRYLRQSLRLDSAAAGVSYARDYLSRPLEILMTIAGGLLLLTCATLASLLLARATVRRREIAIRVAMGASRLRIAGQLTLESVLLALAGAAVALAIGRLTLDYMMRVFGPARSAVDLDLSLDSNVLAFTLAVAVASALLVGLAPAWRASSIAPVDAMRGGVSATADVSVLRVRRVLLSVQIAFAAVLVSGAVLFGETLHNLTRIDPGFNSDRVLVATVDLRRSNVAEGERHAFYTELLDRIRSVRGVEIASVSLVTPMSGGVWQLDASAETATGPQPVHVHYNAVSPGFFDTFETRLVRGRSLSDTDRKGAPLVGIVNETLERQAFGAGGALGRRIWLGDDAEARWVEVVGVVRDAKYRNLRQAVPPTVYVPFVQHPDVLQVTGLAMRSRGPVSELVPEVRHLLGSRYPDAIVKLVSLSAQVDESVATERAFAVLSVSFAVLALVLAVIGVYGVLAYLIAQRRPEIGIRLALGATPHAVRMLVYRHSLGTCAAGIAVGFVVAFWGARYAQSLLYGIAPADPHLYFSTAGIVGAVCALASGVAARRASSTDPMEALRSE